MNFFTLSTIIRELSCLISGSRISRVFEDARKNIIFVLRTGKSDRTLLISPDRGLPRLHLITKKPVSRGSLSPFGLYLKSRAAGGRIERIALLNQDRIVQILFSKQGVESQLLFEIMGHTSNLIVTDHSGTIRSVYYPDFLAAHKPRQLLPGLNYVLPENKAFHHAEKNTDGDRHSPVDEGSANREAEVLYEQAFEQKKIESSRALLRSFVRKRLARGERKLSALNNDLNNAGESENYRMAGDLILENLKKLRTGLSTAMLAGHDGKTVEVRLDPRLSPSRNAERFFKKYKKAKAGLRIITHMMNQAREELSYLQEALLMLEYAENESQLLSCSSLLQEKGYLLSPAIKEPKAAPPALFRRVLYRDWEIVIGKSAAGNDYLTTKLARSHDLWLHAEGMPGSHVLIRNPDAGEIPVPVIEKAAALAAFYSKGRSAGKVPVAFTFARYVKKPKGATPGLVTLLRRKTIMAVPSEE